MRKNWVSYFPCYHGCSILCLCSSRCRLVNGWHSETVLQLMDYRRTCVHPDIPQRTTVWWCRHLPLVAKIRFGIVRQGKPATLVSLAYSPSWATSFLHPRRMVSIRWWWHSSCTRMIPLQRIASKHPSTPRNESWQEKDKDYHFARSSDWHSWVFHQGHRMMDAASCCCSSMPIVSYLSL